jgi:Domain of unknown function (DUF1906)
VRAHHQPWRRAASWCVLAVVLVVPLVLAQGGAASTPGMATYVLDDLDGFDTCTTPSTSTMAAWWPSTNYYYTAVYLGGNNYYASGCSNTNLTASWVSTVGNQGWDFIPIWVGPQAPCTGYNTVMSYDTTTAYNQGVSTADTAMNKAMSLGFSSGSVPYNGTIVYDDLEGYDTGNSACRAAVKSFVNGWDHEIRLGWLSKPGMYGSSCASAVDDWVSLANVPNTAWIAVYNSVNTAWNLDCVPNADWVGDGRIHQYVGGHNETHGGVTIKVDNDCAIGRVAGGGINWGDETDSGGESAAEDPSC